MASSHVDPVFRLKCENVCLSHTCHVSFTRVPMFMLLKNSAQSFRAAENEMQKIPFYSAPNRTSFPSFLFFFFAVNLQEAIEAAPGLSGFL